MSDIQRRMSSLSAQVASLQERLATVSAEYAELIHVLAAFLNRYQAEVLNVHADLVHVQREIADYRLLLGDVDASQAGEAQTALGRIVETDYDTVQEQYERVWKGKGHGTMQIDLSRVLPPASEHLKKLYALIVAKRHPVLANSQESRERRIEFISQVNYAYVHRNEVALEAVADALRDRSNLPAIVSEDSVSEMHNLTYGLEQAIMHIEGQIFELRFGDVAKVRAQAAIAHVEGSDLLAALHRELNEELRVAKEERAALRARL
jgi:predicted transcriptional regulator